MGGTVTSYGPYTDPPSYLNPSQGATTLGASSIGGTGTWYYFALAKDTAKYDEVGTSSQENGTLFYAGTLACDFQHLTPQKELTLQTLLQNRYLKLCYRDVNGNYRALGFDRGATVKTMTQTSGQKPGDMTGYKVTFAWNEMNPGYLLTTDLAGAVITSNFTVQSCNNW